MWKPLESKANRCEEMSNKLNYVLDARELIKKKKDSQYEEKIIQICKKSLDYLKNKFWTV